MGDEAGPHPWDQAARALESTWNHASTSFSNLQREAAHTIHGGMRRVAMRSRQHVETLRAQLMARWGPQPQWPTVVGTATMDPAVMVR
jgi:hypothetical protein